MYFFSLSIQPDGCKTSNDHMANNIPGHIQKIQDTVANREITLP